MFIVTGRKKRTGEKQNPGNKLNKLKHTVDDQTLILILKMLQAVETHKGLNGIRQ